MRECAERDHLSRSTKSAGRISRQVESTPLPGTSEVKFVAVSLPDRYLNAAFRVSPVVTAGADAPRRRRGGAVGRPRRSARRGPGPGRTLLGSITGAPVVSARSTVARSSGRKWTLANRAKPSTIPAMSRSDQPSVGRIRFTTTRMGTPGQRSRRSTSPARESRQSDRVGRAHHEQLVGHLQRPERELVATRPRDQVAGRVVLEAEAGVHDHMTGRARDLDEVLDDPGPHLDPSLGPRESGHDRQPVADRALHRAEPRLQGAVAGEAGGAEESRHLVEDAEVLGDGTAVRVGVHQGRAQSPPGEERRDGHGDRRPSGRARRPPDDDGAPGRVRAGRVGPAASWVDSSSYAASSPSASRASGSSSRSSWPTRTSTPTRAARVRPASSSRPTATTRTAWRCSTSTAVGSRPGASRATTAASAWPALAGRERLVDVDAALEHDHAAPTTDQLQHRRLPGGTRRHDHDDQHVSPCRRRSATRRRSSRRAGRTARPQPGDMASTSIRLPSVPNAASARGCVGHGHAVEHRQTVAHGGAGARGPRRRAGGRRRPRRPRRPRPAPGRRPPRPGPDAGREPVAACNRGPRQQLTGRDLVAEPQIGRQLPVRAEVERRGVRVARTAPGVRRGRRRSARVRHRACPPRPTPGPSRRSVPSTTAPDDDRGGHDREPDPQPRVAPTRR